jgi:uncharacterized membrane protein YjfL (UPF0719 family)
MNALQSADSMSGDELIVTIGSVILGPIVWIVWFSGARSITEFQARARRRVDSLIGILVVCALIVLLTLLFAAADDVRSAPQYIFMYFALGLAWVRVVSWAFPLVGLHPRDDLLERRNPAAFPAWAGAMIGVTCSYAGGNIGNGPGWWVVVFSAGLATIALVLVWTVVGYWTGLVEAVTIDRDPAAGWRFGGLLAAAGVIFGYAVTGDWVSVGATIADFFARAWLILPVVIVAVLLEGRVRPTPQRPRANVITGGVVPALVFLAAAVTGVALIGPWPQL